MTHYAEGDPYTYEDSEVLINIPGIRSQAELDAFERQSTLVRMLSAPPAGRFDYQHLKDIHHHIFQDVYEWAGQERNVPISKGGHQFATPAFIHKQAKILFSNLQGDDLLQGLSVRPFARKAAHYVLELNVLHPFRDGNGRAIRLFLLLLAENAGFTLDPAVLEIGWIDACVKGFAGNEQPMTSLLVQALIPLDQDS